MVNSPTARTLTATATTTATVTVTAPAPGPSPSGSGSGEDGAAKPSSPAPLPSGAVPLTDLSPIRGGDAFHIQSVTMGAKSYEHAMALTYPCDSTSIEYSINERYRSLTFTVGLDDNGTAELIKVMVYGDDRVRKTVGTDINRPQTVTVDMTGVVKLRISSTGECDNSGIVLALADATLHS
ncbi:NPCBM/NEW2 domain-containing protein [Streptomyces sp. TRM76323]|uniref:NPCBM/NEW2 domain-containing protein n=1 Tax=Streptomyces tamarix TaxID=3078565 RepID=A0ABU3QS26_9ACTN|nr:NPCBM/NEW2 domain-containing protein [Streptomyces tamarix]MDT9685539.1 NPCBM/NEW2 domain-containing protein [Streptomyces tamarix]